MKKNYSLAYNPEGDYIILFEKLDDENGNVKQKVYTLGVKDLHSINYQSVVMSILKRFEVNISWFKHSIEVQPNDLQALNMYNLGCNNGNSITMDEFEILKNWII